MPRSGDAARQRLQQAAIHLVAERGFDAVTTAEIARHAGVTERTYFRHFPDKREALFAGEDDLARVLTAALASVDENAAPLAALRCAFDAAVPMLEANRLLSEPLAAVVATTPALRERQVAKGARLVELLAAELRGRGVDAPRAALAAQTGWVALSEAMNRWLADPGDGLASHVQRSFDQLRTVVAELG